MNIRKFLKMKPIPLSHSRLSEFILNTKSKYFIASFIDLRHSRVYFLSKHSFQWKHVNFLKAFKSVFDYPKHAFQWKKISFVNDIQKCVLSIIHFNEMCVNFLKTFKIEFDYPKYAFQWKDYSFLNGIQECVCYLNIHSNEMWVNFP